MAETKKLKKIKWYTKGQSSLAEIYQQTGFIFAFVGKDLKMCHPWVKCRDFLHDAVRTQLTGNSSSIFGFSFNTAVNPPIDVKKMRMLISTHTKGNPTAFKNKAICGLTLLNHFEKYAGVSLSKMEEVNSKGSGKEIVFMLSSPRMWLQSPALVSMYTFLLRLGDKEPDFKDAASLKKAMKKLSEKDGDNDCKYLKSHWNKLHIIIKNRATLFPKKDGYHEAYFDGMQIGSFHNNMGILHLSQASTPIQSLNDKMKEILSEDTGKTDEKG